MTERLKRISELVDLIRLAIEAAYRGDAEHGSFIRGTGTEYVPSPHMRLHELEHEIAEAIREAASGASVPHPQEFWRLALARVEQYRVDDYQSTTMPVTKVARLIREHFVLKEK